MNILQKTAIFLIFVGFVWISYIKLVDLVVVQDAPKGIASDTAATASKTGNTTTSYVPNGTVAVTYQGLMQPGGIRNGDALIQFYQGNLLLTTNQGYMLSSLSAKNGVDVVLDTQRGNVFVVDKYKEPLSFGFLMPTKSTGVSPYQFLLDQDGRLKAYDQAGQQFTLNYQALSSSPVFNAQVARDLVANTVAKKPDNTRMSSYDYLLRASQ